jgi:Inner membrane component of T3SS, cytoplasmic domain
MTIQAQLPHRPQATPRSADRPTLGIDAQHLAGIDAFSLLDHRTRGRALVGEPAPPGRYLSTEHNGERHLIPLDCPIVHIGRGLWADIRLEDPQISRRHSIVAQRGDGARLLDDRSSNGTFLNGRPVTVAYLSDGDVVRLGRVVFRFVEVQPQLKARLPLRRFPLPVRARRRASELAAA